MRKIVKLGMKVFKENLNQKSLFQNFQGKKSHKGFKTSFSVSIIHKVSNFSYKISTKIPIVIKGEITAFYNGLIWKNFDFLKPVRQGLVNYLWKMN